MSATIIVWTPGHFHVRGHKIRDFLWMPQHKKHVWKGREMTAEEYEKEIETILLRNRDMQVRVNILSAPAPAAQSADLDRLNAELDALRKQLESASVRAPVSTIHQGREISVDLAMEVVRRECPEVLKRAYARPVAVSATG